MKTFARYHASFLSPTSAALWLLLALALSSLRQQGFAQVKENPILQTTQTATDSTQGYWQLKTLVDTRMTVIQFFAPNRQLIYQETLPEKWVKPTRHNRQQFDRLLQELMAHQLVRTRIKTERLPTLLPEPSLPMFQPGSGREQNASGKETSFTVSAYVNPSGKLRILVDSPLSQPYKIALTDELGYMQYLEFNNIVHYCRWLDVSALGSGTYSLVIRIAGQDVRYTLNSGQVKRHYQLQSLAVNQR